MALFEIDKGKLIPAQFGRKVTTNISESILSCVRNQILQVIDKSLLPIAWLRSEDVYRNLPSDMPHSADNKKRLISFDLSGQLVIVEVISVLDSKALTDSLAFLSRASNLAWKEIANFYPGGVRDFANAWMNFRDQKPVNVAVSPRMILVVDEIEFSLRSALEVLLESGVAIYELDMRSMANGRLFLDVTKLSVKNHQFSLENMLSLGHNVSALNAGKVDMSSVTDTASFSSHNNDGKRDEENKNSKDKKYSGREVNTEDKNMWKTFEVQNQEKRQEYSRPDLEKKVENVQNMEKSACFSSDKESNFLANMLPRRNRINHRSVSSNANFADSKQQSLSTAQRTFSAGRRHGKYDSSQIETQQKGQMKSDLLQHDLNASIGKKTTNPVSRNINQFEVARRVRSENKAQILHNDNTSVEEAPAAISFGEKENFAPLSFDSHGLAVISALNNEQEISLYLPAICKGGAIGFLRNGEIYAINSVFDDANKVYVALADHFMITLDSRIHPNSGWDAIKLGSAQGPSITEVIREINYKGDFRL